MKINLSTKEDYLALFVRRKGWIAGTFLVLAPAAVLLAWFLPHVYVSEAVILINQREVPQDYVDDLSTTTTEQRLRSIEQTVLSRTSLVQIVRTFEDRLEGFEGLSMDQRLSALRNRIDIRFQTEAQVPGRVPAVISFVIAYEDRNPELAQAIAGELTRLFIQQDNSGRERQVVRLTEFLESQLDDVASQLAESDVKLKDFRSRNQLSLPERTQLNLARLEQLRQEQRDNQEAQDRSRTSIRSLQLQIAATPEMNPPAPRRPVDPVVEEHRQAVLEYQEALEKYTPDHPRIKSLKLRMDLLEAQLPPEPEYDLETGPTPNPLYQNLVTQLRATETDLATLERDSEYLAADIAQVNGLIAASPAVEQQGAELLRRTTDLQEQYDDLRSRLVEAELARNLDGQQGGALFSVLDPANLPLEPSKPSRRNVAMAAVLMSLAAAIGIAILIDLAYQKIWTHVEVERFWGVPVLVEIPSIVTDSDLSAQRRHRANLALSSAGGVVAYGLCLYAIYLHHDFVLQTLDPILRRLVY